MAGGLPLGSPLKPSLGSSSRPGPNATEVVLESRQQPADPEKEQSMRANSEYLGKMLETSLERLERLVTSESES